MKWSDSNNFSDIQKILADIFESQMGANVKVHDIIDL